MTSSGTYTASPPRGRVRRALAALLGTTLFAAPLLTGVAPAEAAVGGPAGNGISVKIPYSSNDVWLGAMAAPGNLGISNLLWCIQGQVQSPSDGATIASIDYVTDPALAWVVETYEGIDTQLSRAAIGYLTHVRQEVPGHLGGGDTAQAKKLLEAATPANVKAQAAAYLAEGERNGGPFTAPAPTIETADRRTGWIHDVMVVSDAGVVQVGKSFTLTLDGPAVFELTGTNTLTGTTTGVAQSFKWIATGNGTVSPKVKFENVATTTLGRVYFNPATGHFEAQGVLTTAFRAPWDPEEIEVAVPQIDVIKDFQPEITTQVASIFVDKGASLVDQVTTAAAAGDTWSMVDGSYVPLLATGTLYGPFASQPAQSATVPAGAPVVGVEALTFNGPGTKASPGTLRAAASGYYTWVWKIDKAVQPAVSQPYIRAGYTDDFGRVAETSIIPFQTQLSTAVGSRLVDSGESFVDAVTVSPVAGDVWLTRRDGVPVALTAVGTLYGPFASQPAQSEGVLPGAPVVGTETLIFDAAGTKNSAGNLRATGSGYYTWVWEIVKASQPVLSQPYVVGDVRDAFGRVAETSIVPFQPIITTQRADRVVAPGDGLIDQVSIDVAPGDLWLATSAGDPVQVTAVGTAYGPFLTPQPEGSAIPADAPVAGTESLTFAGAGKASTTGSVKASGPGFYTWVWRVTKATQPVAFREYIRGDFTDLFMLQAETTTVKHTLKHVSLAREYNVAPGGRAFDSIVITGMPSDHASFEGLGEWVPDVKMATVRVYGPMRDVPTTVEVPAGTPLLYETQIPATNGLHEIGYDDADPISPTLPGHYVFVYSVAGDDRLNAYDSPFNDVLERFFVPTGSGAPVQVATQATKSASTDEPFEDTALVVGDILAGSYLVFEAFGPQDPTAPAECTSPFYTSDRIAVDRAGYYTSGKTSVATTGVVYWIATIYDKNHNAVDAGVCGDPFETTTITPAPLTLTTQAVAKVALGSAAHDTATVTGHVPAGTTLSFAAYKQESTIPVCLSPTFVTEYGEIPGPGQYESAKVVFAEPGTYFWIATIEAADGSVVARGKCGEVSETTTVHTDQLALVTKAMPEVALGELAHDTAIISGYVPPGTTLSFSAYLQDGDVPTCEVPLFSTYYGVVDQAGEYVSEEVIFPATGSYNWVATLTSWDGTLLARDRCGVEGETTIVFDGNAGAGGRGGGVTTLPWTGVKVTQLVIFASVVTGSGLALVLISRRRRVALEI